MKLSWFKRQSKSWEIENNWFVDFNEVKRHVYKNNKNRKVNHNSEAQSGTTIQAGNPTSVSLRFIPATYLLLLVKASTPHTNKDTKF